VNESLTRTAAADAPDPVALRVRRGVGRLLERSGFAWLPEVTVASGRRVDLMALDAQGRILVVEIKSSLADFRADRKWPEYLGWCDLFAFAVPEDFPLDVLPGEEGLLVSDGFEAEWLREPPLRRLAAARRRAVTLLFARTAARRLAQLLDPPPGLGIEPASQRSIR